MDWHINLCVWQLSNTVCNQLIQQMHEQISKFNQTFDQIFYNLIIDHHLDIPQSWHITQEDISGCCVLYQILNLFAQFIQYIHTQHIIKYTQMTQSYRMPVGITTNDRQLINLQKELLKQHYDKVIHGKEFYQEQIPIKESIRRRNNSEKNIRKNQFKSYQLPSERNVFKDQEIRQFLAQDLKSQIQQNQFKKKYSSVRKLQQQKVANNMNKMLLEQQFIRKTMEKQKIQAEMKKDYEDKLRRKQQQNIEKKKQKQSINNRLKTIQALSSPQKRIKIPPNNPQTLLSEQFNGATKIPDYYKNVSNYQLQNYKNYERNVKNGTQAQKKHYNDIIDQRVNLNKQRQQQYQQYERMLKLKRKQELQSTLQQQILESEQKKKQLLAYDKSKFYGSVFANVYNPICNPVDSKFCKDNKYLIKQITNQGAKIKSRQSMDNGNYESSSLARNGSQVFL